MNYDDIKALAYRQNVKVSDLLALATNNDPFYTGRPAQRKQAEWFARLWEDFGYTTGVHLRRFHYRLVHHTNNPTKYDGTSYQNTVTDWNELCHAGKFARYLGLVPADAFVDRRNPSPHIYAQYERGTTPPIPETEIISPNWHLPRIQDTQLELPEVVVTGYDYALEDQPYHLEVWAEKSTMDDVLIPVCSKYGVNLVTGIGEMSITAVDDLIQRVSESEKPARILYISDFDMKGKDMPISVSRKIEFMLSERHDADIKLRPIVLTAEQVKEYDLPRIPYEIKTNISESRQKALQTRKDAFEAAYGNGVVELDALQGLFPGELARLVSEQIQRYRDTDLPHKLRERENEAQEIADRVLDDTLGPYLGEMRELRDEINAYIARYKDDFNAAMKGYQSRANDLLSKINGETERLHINLPPRDCADVHGDDGNPWLFDSNRDYFEQLNIYKENRPGGQSENQN